MLEHRVVCGHYTLEPMGESARVTAFHASIHDFRFSAKSEIGWRCRTDHAGRKISAAEYQQRLDELSRHPISGFEGRELVESLECPLRQSSINRSVVDPCNDVASDDLSGGAFQHPIDYAPCVHDGIRTLQPPLSHRTGYLIASGMQCLRVAGVAEQHRRDVAGRSGPDRPGRSRSGRGDDATETDGPGCTAVDRLDDAVDQAPVR